MTVPGPTASPSSAPVIQPAAAAEKQIPSTTVAQGIRRAGSISRTVPNLGPERFAPPGLQAPSLSNGTENDAYQLLAAITGSNSARPQQLLAALSNQASSNFSAVEKVYRQHLGDELDRQIASLSANERSQAIARLKSPAIAALLAALHEGVGTSGLKDRNLTEQVLRQMAQQLRQLQMRFGIKTQAPISKQANDEARAAVDHFIQRFDNGVVIQRRNMDSAETSQMPPYDTLFNDSDLARLKPHLEYPFVCEQFIIDVNRAEYVLEHPDGYKEFLVPPNIKRQGSVKQIHKVAAERLFAFCGGDQEKSLLLSRLINQSVLSGTVDRNMHSFGKLDLPTDNSGAATNIRTMGFKGHHYLIRANEDNSHSVLANYYNQLTEVMASDDGSIPGQHLNTNLSHYYAQLQMKVSADNQVHPERLKYDFATVPLMNADNNLHSLSDNHSFHMDEVSDHKVIAELHDMDTTVELQFRSADLREANRLAEDVSQLQKKITESDIVSARKEILQKRLEFIRDSNAEINQLLESGQEADARRAIERAGELHDDLRLLQQDLKLKLDHWNDNKNHPELATLTAAVFAALGATASEIEGTAADRRAEINDASGNLNAVVKNSLIARAENALQQAQVNSLAVSKAIASLSMQQVDDSEQLLALLQEAHQRYAAAKINYQNVLSGQATNLIAGPGALGRELQKLQQQVLERLEQGEQLPSHHPQLSEANLFRIRVEKFKSDHPKLAGVLADFDADFAQFSEETGNNRSWNPIETRFNDIDSQGRLHAVTSRIVPAKHFAAGFKDYGGSNNGVCAHSRTSGLHLSNLASSSLVNSRGIAFTGLRYGIMDAYTITPKAVASMPESQLEQLHRNTLATDNKWREWAAKRGGGEFESDLRLMRTSAGSRIAAERARQVANQNAAVELVRAAIVEDPFLYERAIAGKDVEMTLDSVSLVTPDYLRGLIGTNSERRMQQNQRAALAELAKAPIRIELIDKQGNLHMVPVKIDARDFNFGVNSYAVTRGTRIPLFGKLMGWDSADKRNGKLLERMLGPLDSPSLGGEVGDVLQYLETGKIFGEMSEQVRHTLDGQRQGDAFADKKARAAAIALLASQIKQIYNAGTHRRGGSDPYKMVARLTVLSNLLGHTTCYNCKSGKDRTGQLDAEAKMIAHRLTIGEPPNLGEKFDHVRRTNFALKTGNLELQKYNTGLEGYKLDVPALSDQLASPLARKMFSGDSSSVSA